MLESKSNGIGGPGQAAKGAQENSPKNQEPRPVSKTAPNNEAFGCVAGAMLFVVVVSSCAVFAETLRDSLLK